LKRRWLVFSFVASCMLHSGESEVSVNVSTVKGRNNTTTTDAGSLLSVSPKDATSLSLRFGSVFTKVGAAELVGQVTIHAEYSTQYDFTESRFSYREGSGKYKNEGISLGLQSRWRHFLEYGIGGEVRYEHLTLANPEPISTGQYRPWLSLYLGRSFRGPGFTPFFGIEVAAPLTKSSHIGLTTDTGATTNDPKDFLKNMSPKMEISFVIGMRR